MPEGSLGESHRKSPLESRGHATRLRSRRVCKDDQNLRKEGGENGGGPAASRSWKGPCRSFVSLALMTAGGLLLCVASERWGLRTRKGPFKGPRMPKSPQPAPKSGIDDQDARAVLGSPAFKVSEGILLVAQWTRVQGGPWAGALGREPRVKWISMGLPKARVLRLSVYNNPQGGEDPKCHALFVLLSLERVMCPEGAGGVS